MRPWWSRRGPAMPLDRIADIFRTFLLLELVKGLVLTGRHLFARRIAMRYPEPDRGGMIGAVFSETPTVGSNGK